MTDTELLAKRLRQAVQGCTIHQHGPVQAWNAVEEAVSKGAVEREEVAFIALEASRLRMNDLRAMGVLEDDLRFRKEVATYAFIERLLGAPRKRSMLDGFLASVAIDRAAVMESKIYERLETVDDVRVFMEYHVFAVWDFMCLVKALQRLSTSVGGVTWLPVGSPEVRRLVNQVVLDEESDAIGGRVASHFEYYLDAMREIGAGTKTIEKFSQLIAEGHLVGRALEEAGVPQPVHDFVLTTLGIVNTGHPWEIAAAFAIGREQIIPTMFRRLLDSLKTVECSMLKEYLDRHIEVDSGEHGPAAMELLKATCGDVQAQWDGAASAARRMLKARRSLWDSTILACKKQL